MPSATLESAEESGIEPLTKEDRCDAGCGAQARVRVWLPSSGVLIFCAHHFRQHEAALTQNDVTVDDFTEDID